MVPVSFYQFAVRLGDVDENLKKVEKIVPLIPEGGIFALPEMFCCGFDYENLETLADRGKEILHFLGELSEKTRGVVVATLPLKREGGIYNTAAVFDRGKLKGFRRKVELFPLYKEREFFTAAPEGENTVFETSVGKIGVVICFEVRFNRFTNRLRKEGAELIVIPAMWGVERREHFKVLTRARAVETQSFALAVNAWGKTGKTTFGGASALYGPWGELLTYAEDGEVLSTAWVDLSEVYRVRKKIPLG